MGHLLSGVAQGASEIGEKMAGVEHLSRNGQKGEQLQI